MVTQHHQGFNLSGEEGDAYFPSMCYFVETLTTAFCATTHKRRGRRGRERADAPRGPSTKEDVVSVRLFIGNLPYAATEAELREHLSSVGVPAQVVLPVDRETGRPRGFAFVDYTDRTVAEEAIRRFNQQPFQGRPLAVSEARPREERGPGGPRPGGFSGPRPGAPGGFTPRSGSGFTPRADPPAGGGAAARNRNFGPDAPPKNRRKPQRKESDRGPRGPIKERPVGRLYDADEDWRAQDEELDIDNVATSAKDEDTDDEKE
jgi:cold-inducible RNA-binding protein